MKLCECGCGNPAPIAKKNNTRWGWIKGEPLRFLRGQGNIGGKPITDKPLYLVNEISGCWVWQFYKDDKGYGVIKRKGKNYQAHRFIFEQYKEKIPEGMQLDHKCRNTSCVNPDHLEIVDNAENCRRGVNAKLTKEQVCEIKKLLNTGIKQSHIAKRFNVSPCCINDIIKERSWI